MFFECPKCKKQGAIGEKPAELISSFVEFTEFIDSKNNGRYFRCQYCGCSFYYSCGHSSCVSVNGQRFKSSLGLDFIWIELFKLPPELFRIVVEELLSGNSVVKIDSFLGSTCFFMKSPFRCRYPTTSWIVENVEPLFGFWKGSYVCKELAVVVAHEADIGKAEGVCPGKQKGSVREK